MSLRLLHSTVKTSQTYYVKFVSLSIALNFNPLNSQELYNVPIRGFFFMCRKLLKLLNPWLIIHFKGHYSIYPVKYQRHVRQKSKANLFIW